MDPTLFYIGCFFLVGYLAHVVGRLTHIPRVTLLLLVGICTGPAGFNIVPQNVSLWFPMVSQIALSVIGFELGEKILGKSWKSIGGPILQISLVKVLGTALVVFVALIAFQAPLVLSILLAGIAPATAPAATADVIDEIQAKGEVTDTTLRLVAIDDAWGVILFSLLLVIALGASGSTTSLEILWLGIREVLGALLLGVAIGLPMAWLTGRVSEGELTLIETLGFVFLCSGAAELLNVSYILACMATGCVVSNLAHHHKRPFHAIKNVRQPFLVIFFLLAGFSADISSIQLLGLFGGVYICARSLGIVLAATIGAYSAKMSQRISNHIGWCLLPQAGIALGLALLAAERFPEVGGQVLAIIVATSVVFEVIGPVLTRVALSHAGENSGRDSRST